MDREDIVDKRIADLPDYAALKKLSAALWQQDNAYHGAAIMVGAGFSRSAASTGDITKKLPIWNDLSKALAIELGASSNSDPLRLAEEYYAYFGKQGLYDLVKKEINDAAWTPGELYTSLLALPWSEVLTTNWDTLLERASADIHQPVYHVVAKQEDLSSARSPRIVKLHGTVNLTEDLIFTQEDYRKYPQRHAAFVNFARQVFIENELCLLGFSGDDPNFLQWAGWVRDQLATHARRIYLVGALNLTAAKRKYLESINVAPIDLGALVADFDDHDARHHLAITIFLTTLKSLKPKQSWEWHPTSLHRSAVAAGEIDRNYSDPKHAAAMLQGQLPTLEADRKSYPGWLVCPNKQRVFLEGQISDPYPTPKALLEMASDSREKLLYEIAWRHAVTYQVPSKWLIQELLAICDPAKSCVLTKQQQLEIALLLLKNTRWLDDVPESRSIEQLTKDVLERGAKYWPESANEVAYHTAIVARDRFDYPALESLAGKITDADPVWKLKKASLLAELGRFVEGEALIAEAHRELLGQYRNERNSIYVFSRLAWAHWILRGVEMWNPGKEFTAFPSIYHDAKCSPWDHIDDIQNRIYEALEKQRKQREIEPSFEAGNFTDNSNSLTLSNQLHPILLLDGTCNSAGMALRWNAVGFLAEPASKLAELQQVNGMYRFALAVRTASSETSEALKAVFSRTQVASLSKHEADYLLVRCTHAVNYWSSILLGGKGDAKKYALDRLRVFIEVLARVSVRTTPEQAKQIFRLACELGAKEGFRHFWLLEPLNHLINYSLKSVPDSEQHELLLDALRFPLQKEIHGDHHDRWPNPVIKFPGSRGQNSAIDRRIDEIIEGISPCSSKSSPALLRLLPLIESGYLTEAERNKIAVHIWGSVAEYKTVPETGLLKYVLLYLPATDHSAVRKLVRGYLFESNGDQVFDASRLMDISNAAQANNIKEFPSEEQAADYFDKLVAWRSKRDEKDPFRFLEPESQIAGLIGEALLQSIVPALPAHALTEENFCKLHAFYVEAKSPGAIAALTYFAAASDLFTSRVEKLIRKGLQDLDGNKVAYASYAALKWRELSDSPVTRGLILRLINLLGSNRIAGSAAMLWTANQMYNNGYLSDNETESLADILPVMFDNASYRDVSSSSREAVSVSLVRAAVVRLSGDILNNSQDRNSELLRVLEEARQDALPEVRFAVKTDT